LLRPEQLHAFTHTFAEIEFDDETAAPPTGEGDATVDP